MRLTRFLKPLQIKLELATREWEALPEGWGEERALWAKKEAVLRELVEVLESTGKVANPSKLFTDLLNRERKATTAVGEGIAIPHVRTMQIRSFAMAFARSTPGLRFDAADGQPVHFFICVVSPPYDDKLYLQVYKRIGEIFKDSMSKQTLLEATDEHSVIQVLQQFGS
jgi:mannitol/fructose-specific phosphotransferase system IIA component (Ntr-type)